MNEAREVLAAISKYADEGRPMALATIVSVTGSTYRRPGARLVIPQNAPAIGNLSGGCLEGEVEELAREVMADGAAQFVSYDLNADDEAVWGWGLGCNGTIEVFVEPGDRAVSVAAALTRAIDDERRVAVVTVVDGHAIDVDIGSRVVVHADDSADGAAGPATDRLIRIGRAALAGGENGIVVVPVHGGVLRVFVEVIEPPLRLLVCGAGHDAIPMAAAGRSLGWRVVVADERPAFLTEARFPGARLIETDPIAVAQFVDDRTWAIVMSHNYLRDRAYLRALLGSPARYIGMLGPGARLERLLGDLRSDGVDVPAAVLGRVHGPAGLDLGAEEPEEIAASVVAEILALSRSRGGGHLKGRAGPIHDRGHAPGTLVEPTP
jgi:xanthine dehydrogenase accessory factor